MNVDDEDRPEPRERGVGDAVRAAVERTLEATAGPATTTRERAAELVDDVVRRGREAGDRIARRSQQAGSELAGRRPASRDDLGRQLEALERRLAAIEALLREQLGPEAPERGGEGEANPEPKG